MSQEPEIQALKSGDKRAFKLLVEQFQNRVYNTCLGFIPNALDAEDICQEVFVEVFASVKNFKGDAKLSTWIYRIAVNKCLEELRRRKQQKRAAYFKNLLGIGSEAEDVKSDEFTHPGFAAENQEKAHYLMKAIAQLAENQKIAFTLSQIDGKSYNEVSEIMGVSFSSVESLIFRARKNLKTKLAHIKKEL